MIVTSVHFPHMQHKSFGKMACPIARSLERVGEWWSILIIRDALHGFTRFDEFQKSLNIAPNMLTRRLSALVDTGLLKRRRYSERPPRYEYILTDMGRDFRPVIVAMAAWGTGTLPRRARAYCSSIKRPIGQQIPCWSIGGVEDCLTSATLYLPPALPPASVHAAAMRSIKRNHSTLASLRDRRAADCKAESAGRHDYGSTTQGR